MTRDWAKATIEIGDLLCAPDEQFPLFFLVIDIKQRRSGWDALMYDFESGDILWHHYNFGAQMPYQVVSK